MSITGLAIIYIIIWWIVFFAILPIDVERKKLIKIAEKIAKKESNPLIHSIRIISYQKYLSDFKNNKFLLQDVNLPNKKYLKKYFRLSVLLQYLYNPLKLFDFLFEVMVLVFQVL